MPRAAAPCASAAVSTHTLNNDATTANTIILFSIALLWGAIAQAGGSVAILQSDELPVSDRATSREAVKQQLQQLEWRANELAALEEVLAAVEQGVHERTRRHASMDPASGDGSRDELSSASRTLTSAAREARVALLAGETRDGDGRRRTMVSGPVR